MTPKTPHLKIIITTGPTREAIDRIRFISNYSTGTIGHELAKEAARRKHKIILISGPVDLKPLKSISYFRVNSAKDMQAAVNKHFKWCNCLIMAAAVSDYRPKRYLKQKLKKNKNEFSLKLIKNPDILKEIGKRKRGKIIIGFALETEELIKNAKEKIRKKNLDFIVANGKNKELNPFGKGKIDVYLIDRDFKMEKFKSISKKMLSKVILDKVENL